MSYVDVFISHGQRDTAKAVALKKKIEDLRSDGLRFYCYIDADDPELAQKDDKTIADDLLLSC